MQFTCSKVGAFLLAIFLVSAGASQAATINITRDATNPHETTYGLHPNTGAYGSQLDGAQIGAQFADGSAENLAWTADPSSWTEPNGVTYYSQNGFARGDDVNLFMSWDGIEMSTTSLLTSLTIDLAPADAVFDTTYIFDNDPSGGSTQGSSFGYEFELYSAFENLPGAIDVVYSGIVNVAGALAAGDLFTTMTIDFSGLTGGGLLGGLSFRSDIDAMLVANDLTPVPLPASILFMLLGLAALMLLGRGRQSVPSATPQPV